MNSTVSRRQFFRLAGASALFAGVAACTPAPQPGAEGDAGAASALAGETIELEMWGQSGGAWDEVFAGILEQVEEETGILVEYLRAPGGWVEQTQRLNSSIAAAAVPDIAHVKDFSMWDYAWRGAVTGLDDMYEAEGYDQSVLRDSIWDAMHYNDTLYGVPWKGSFVWNSYCNNKLFEEAGLDPIEDFPEDWDGLIEVSELMTDASNGQYGHVFYELGTREVNLMLFSVYVGQAGGNIFNEDRTALALDSEETHTALQFMYDMLWTWGYALPPEEMASRWDLVYADTIATWMMGPWFIPGAVANAPQLEFTLHKWPCNVTCDNADTPECMLLLNNAPNPEASWTIMHRLNSPDVELQLSAPGIGGFIPAYIENLDKFWEQGDENVQEQYKRAAEIAAASPLRKRHWVEGYEEVVSVVMPELEAVWFDQATVVEGLAAAQAAGTEALQRAQEAGR